MKQTNSLYPEHDGSTAVPSVVPIVPDPKQTKAEIDYLVEVFRAQTECLRKTGQSLSSNIPSAFQPDLPGE